MRDRPESTPTAAEPDYCLPDSAIRGTLRVRLRQEDRDALQTIAEQVLDLTQAAHLIYPDHRLAVVGDMRGVADDLYHLAGFCGYLIGAAAHSSPEPAELRMVVLAESAGRRIEALAQEVEAAVAAEERP
jgi:hypothetical protein